MSQLDPRVRITADGQRILQCHSRGAKEYSPFFCPLVAFGEVRSIEDHYQSTKVFTLPEGHDIKASNWRQAKALQNYKPALSAGALPGKAVLKHYELPNGLVLGSSNTNVTDLVIQWYIALWYKYLRLHPDLIEAAKGYDGYEDIFEGKFPFSQAKVVAQCVAEGVESLYPMWEELRFLLKQ